MISFENMENTSREDDKMKLPPGFRFHPTDEELITHYLSHKVLDTSFHAIAIGEVDLNKCEPWDLPSKAKIGEKEWYFFYLRGRKYPTGLRTNRATEAGYWKATGKDKEIYRAKPLAVVGMKKTLVFYKGRAPRGEKTNWVMHEYRLEGNSSKNEWVICRVFQKSPGGKKAYISGEASRVTCFSHPPTEDDDIIHDNPSPAVHVHNTIYAPNLHYPDSISAQQQSMLSLLYENRNNNNVNGQSVNVKTSEEELSAETGDLSTDISSVVSNHDMGQRSFHEPPTSAGPVHLDCLWNY